MRPKMQARALQCNPTSFTSGFARQWQLSPRAAYIHSISPPRVQQPGSKSIPWIQNRTLTQASSSTSRAKEPTSSYDTPASKLNHDVTSEEKSQYDASIASHSKKAQIRTPWHRDGSDKPPVSRLRQASAMAKGKLLTTPTRLFKLILPLTTRDHNVDRKTVEPLALLVHPSQPLSYLERLIQSELPLLEKDGKEKIPDVNFRAQDSLQDQGSNRKVDLSDENEGGKESDQDGETQRTSADTNKAKDLEDYDKDGDGENTHLRGKTPDAARDLRGGPGEGGVETYSASSSGSTPNPDDFVRWSKSTEIGDFIRDASRGSNFAVEIEGAPEQIFVGVPTFGDRTYYIRLRLRKKAGQIASMSSVKRECDLAAHNYSQNIAKAGFGGMCAWGGVVAWLTFETDLGWDVMEPVTYLVGLVGLLGGYAWFLANNREASYRAAMNLTVSRRQQKLYDSKGFNLDRYNNLVQEGNDLRREIRAVASEYDVEWDERRDAQDERVVEALKEHRDEKKKKKKDDDDDDD